MKVELQCGDIITIPEGCKAIVKDGSVVFEKERQKFENGDILCSVDGDTIVIFKEQGEGNSRYFYSHYNTDCSGVNGCWNSAAFRHVTDEEKQLLFAKMKEQGLQWNAKEKRVERIRNRVKWGDNYLYINNYGNIIKIPDYHTQYDNNRFDLGNYYLSEEREQAEKDAAAIEAIFEKRTKV